MDFPRFFGQLTPLDNASDIFSHPEPRQAANGETVTKRPAQMKPIGHPMNIKTTFFRLRIYLSSRHKFICGFPRWETIPKLTRVHKTLFPIFSRREFNWARLFLELCEFFYCPDSTVQIDRLCKFLLFWRLIQFYLFCGLRSYALFYTAFISTWNTRCAKN